METSMVGLRARYQKLISEIDREVNKDLSLPMYPELTGEQIDRVAEVVGNAMMKKA